MGPLVAVLFFIGCIVVWAFFAFPPAYANEKSVSIFNWTVVGMGLFLGLLIFFNVGTIFTTPSYLEYKLPISLAAALGFNIVFLGVFFLLRNFWIFKPPRRPGGFPPRDVLDAPG